MVGVPSTKPLAVARDFRVFLLELENFRGFEMLDLHLSEATVQSLGVVG